MLLTKRLVEQRVAEDEMNATVIYRTDSEGRIVFVNEEWNRFAIENDAPEMAVPDELLGRTLFSFIKGPEVVEAYAAIIGKVHLNKKPVRIPFRCDGPTIKRFMELTISPLTDGSTEFAAEILRQEEMEYLPLLDPARQRRDEFIRVCSWCRNVWLDGEWVEIATAVRRLHLFDAPEMPAISHGICEPCRDKLNW